MSSFATVEALAAHLRQELESKKYLLLFAYNGTGKTWFSVTFSNINKPRDSTFNPELFSQLQQEAATA